MTKERLGFKKFAPPLSSWPGRPIYAESLKGDFHDNRFRLGRDARQWSA
jgi:hypothetical protein